MDLTRQAQQTNVKVFSYFGIIFRISYNFLNNSGVGFCKRGGAFVLIRSARVLVIIPICCDVNLNDEIISVV